MFIAEDERFLGSTPKAVAVDCFTWGVCLFLFKASLKSGALFLYAARLTSSGLGE